MATLPVYDVERQKVSDIELDDQLFGADVDLSVLHDAVRRILASQRRGTAATKNKAETRGGGAKPWRQKGTGRARAGSRRSPLWRGGGTIFGPMPRDYFFSLPRKQNRAALKVALGLKHREGKLILLQDIPLDGFKTKKVLEVMERFQVRDGLIVTDKQNTFLERSARNIRGVKVLRCENLNVFDILKHEHLIVLSPAIHRIQGVLV